MQAMFVSAGREGGPGALVERLATFAGMAAMLVYVYAALEISLTEWRGVAVVMAGYFALVSLGGQTLRSRAFAPIARYLDAKATGDPSADEKAEAFRCVIASPRKLQHQMLWLWILAAVLAAACLWLLGYQGWGLGPAVLIIAGTLGGLVSSALSYYSSKRRFGPLRESIAAEIPDADERRLLVRRVPLVHRVTFLVGGAVLISLACTLLLAHANATSAIASRASSWQERALDVLAARITATHDLGAALAATFPDRSLLPYPVRFALVESATETARTGGDLAPLAGTGDLVVRRVLADGRILSARVARSELRGVFAALPVMLGVVSLMVMGLSLCVAQLFGRDLGRSIASLCDEAERMALGDLRGGRMLESDDELGDLARSFRGMGLALHATVTRVAEAADRVDAAASEMALVSDSVAEASADQVRRIQQASELMLEIKGQVAGVAESAQILNVSVDESSSSVLELGAASDELNETASVLSNKVDQVSSSIEQMVRSVKQVSASSEALSGAAIETSSSMEEMASAMRVVDTNAELTAGLSREVVASAEIGQTKVSQTIDGMTAIREATDSAEGVIQGLGARAKEIGAILDVIDDVAEETNLLALNAAIIAAQAGEHGRAFSVVADEIKELADRVLASTKEISGLIHAVQGESEKAIGAVEEGSRSVASGVALSAEAGSSLEEITRAARESGMRIAEIVSAVREQTAAAGMVVGLMDRVRDGVEQITAAGQEQDRGNEVVYRSAITMREVAQQVRRTTEEQSRGYGRIRESIEGVREAVERINGSLQEQTAACSKVAEFLEQVFERTRSNEDAAQCMGESTRSLVSQAEALRADVAKFQL